MAEPNVLVVSRDADFTQVVAELVKRELGLPCAVAADAGAAQALLAAGTIVVTHGDEAAEWPCPALELREFPVKIQHVLESITALRRQLEQDDLPLGGGYTLNGRQKQLAYGGASVGLTDKEIQIIQCLASEGAGGVTREQLLKRVWGMESSLDTHTLETHIYRLRSKFRELSGDDSMIAAMNGGYALIV